MKFELIEKLVIDLVGVKTLEEKGNEGTIDKSSVNLLGFIKGKWVPFTQEEIHDEKLVAYLKKYFREESEPEEDDGRTGLFLRKTKEELEKDEKDALAATVAKSLTDDANDEGSDVSADSLSSS